MQNKSLHRAKNVKENEFYTQLTDIENELKYYRKHFKDKVVYCNCDDPRISNFFYYFSYNFEKLALKKIITTCYKNQNPDLFSQNNTEKAIYLEYKADKNGSLTPYPEYMKALSQPFAVKGKDNVPDPKDIGIGYLSGDGDFRSQECIELLKQADIVVTNPPFSLLREYVAQLIEYNKKFLIIGNMNAITYKEIFSYIKENKLWLGYRSGDIAFQVPHHYKARKTRYWEDENGQKWRSLGNICWFTNLDISKRHEDIILYKTYKEEEYPKYDNYDAINVDRVADIPMDYQSVMGVPITFLDKYNPEQFEIVDYWNGGTAGERIGAKRIETMSNGKIIFWNGPTVNKQTKYFRILIKKRV